MVILIVDDNAIIRQSLADILQDEGYEILHAASTDEALGVLASDRARVHLILLGHRLGDGTGWALAEYVAGWNIPVVTMTASEDEPPEEGAVGTKPFSVEESSLVGREHDRAN
jgi:CheY-like chemotaxis protein